MDEQKIGTVTTPAGSSRDADWWHRILDHAVLKRTGVPVVFWPRPFMRGKPARIENGWRGACGRVVLAPICDLIRYPGEVGLWNVMPGALIFGESWVASGDLIVVDELLARYQQGGAHW